MPAGVYKDTDGRWYRNTGQGYVPLTEEQAELAEMSRTERVATGAVNSLKRSWYGLNDMLDIAGSLIHTGTTDVLNRESVDVALAQAEEEARARDIVDPTAQATSELLGLVGEEAATGGLGTAAISGLRLANRLVDGSRATQRGGGLAVYDQPGAGDAPWRPNDRGGGDGRWAVRPDGTTYPLREDELSASQLATIGEYTEQMKGAPDADFGPDPGFAPRSAGAAEARGYHWEAMKQLPGLRPVLESLEGWIGDTRPLGANQIAILTDPEGRWRQLDFEMLPGQEGGNDVVTQVIKGHPILGTAFDDKLQKNAERLQDQFMRAAGLPGRFEGSATLGQFDRALEEAFSGFASKVGDVLLPPEIAERMLRHLTQGEQALLREAMTDDGLLLSGDDFMTYRSNLSETAFSSGQALTPAVRRDALQLMDYMHDTMAKRLDPEDMAEWRRTQQRFRLRLAAENAINNQGDISVKGLNRGLQRVFQKEYKYSGWAPRDAGLDDDLVDLLDLNYIATAFSDNLADSGTATRSMLNSMLNNPVEAAKQAVFMQAGKRFIIANIVGDPHKLDELPAVDDWLDAANLAE